MPRQGCFSRKLSQAASLGLTHFWGPGRLAAQRAVTEEQCWLRGFAYNMFC